MRSAPDSQILEFDRALAQLEQQAASLQRDSLAISHQLHSRDPRELKDAVLLKQGLDFRREIFEQKAAHLRALGQLLEDALDKALAADTLSDLRAPEAASGAAAPPPTPLLGLLNHQHATIRQQHSIIRQMQEVNSVLENELARLRKDLLREAPSARR